MESQSVRIRTIFGRCITYNITLTLLLLFGRIRERLASCATKIWLSQAVALKFLLAIHPRLKGSEDIQHGCRMAKTSFGLCQHSSNHQIRSGRWGGGGREKAAAKSFFNYCLKNQCKSLLFGRIRERLASCATKIWLSQAVALKFLLAIHPRLKGSEDIQHGCRMAKTSFGLCQHSSNHQIRSFPNLPLSGGGVWVYLDEHSAPSAGRRLATINWENKDPKRNTLALILGGKRIHTSAAPNSCTLISSMRNDLHLPRHCRRGRFSSHNLKTYVAPPGLRLEGKNGLDCSKWRWMWSNLSLKELNEPDQIRLHIGTQVRVCVTHITTSASSIRTCWFRAAWFRVFGNPIRM